MATIHDVARAAGVSAATVSHVLNESRFVSPQTRERVLQAIEALRYRRDDVARSLRRARTSTIGILISDVTNPFLSGIVRGVGDVVDSQGNGYNIILCNADENPEKERLYLDVLQEKRIEGLVIVPVGVNHDRLAEITAGSFPVVFVDRVVEGIEADAVVADNEHGSFQLVQHMIACGHRRIAVLAADHPASSLYERLNGYRRALDTAGIPIDPGLFYYARPSFEEARATATRLMDEPNGASVVFCTNNTMTVGFLQAHAQRGVEHKHRIAFGAFDDFPWSEALTPRLTAVAQFANTIGSVAAQLMFGRIKGTLVGKPVKRVVPSKLEVRESCLISS